MDNNERAKLAKRFPWLDYINGVADAICRTLWDKERHYSGSWQRRGGIGAFMMASRKWDRIESISSSHNYDIFQAISENTGDIMDDVDDLIGYLILIRAEAKRRTVHGAPSVELAAEYPSGDDK